MKSTATAKAFDFDQELLQAAIGKELDSLETTLNWSVGLAVGVWLTSLQNAQVFRPLGFEMSRNQLFLALVAIYLGANAAVLISLTRIRQLLLLLNGSNFVKSLVVVATHRFIFNPFSFYGMSPAARLTNALGLPALIAVWWTCMGFVAQSGIEFRTSTREYWLILVLETVLFVFNVTLAWAVLECYKLIYHRLASIDPSLRTLVHKTGMDRIYAGIAVGVLGLSRTLLLILRMWR